MTLASCELDYAPENTLVDEKVYKNEKTAEAALMGNYVFMQTLTITVLRFGDWNLV